MSAPLPPDDPLEQAIEALRSESAPPGPDAQTLADTLAAIRKQEQLKSFWQRTVHMTLTQKIAASIAMTLGGLTLYFVLTLFSTLSGVTYGQVATMIRSLRTMSCDLTVNVKDADKPMTAKMLVMSPGKMRQEHEDGVVTVSDTTAHRSLVLFPKTKTAILTEISTTQPTTAKFGAPDMIDSFKKLADASAEPAGERQIGEIKTKAFSVKQGNYNVMVFVDPKSGTPVRIEFELPAPMQSVVMDHFNFDADLDASLFSTDPPAGYTLQTRKMDVTLDPVENLVPVLRAYATRKDGQFPPSLQDWGDIVTTITKDAKNPEQADPEIMKAAAGMGAMHAFFFSYKKGTEFDYLPDNAKLGDADKIVFWYQPKGSQKHTAIYGDLHVAEVSAEQLPKSK